MKATDRSYQRVTIAYFAAEANTQASCCATAEYIVIKNILLLLPQGHELLHWPYGSSKSISPHSSVRRLLCSHIPYMINHAQVWALSCHFTTS